MKQIHSARRQAFGAEAKAELCCKAQLVFALFLKRPDQGRHFFVASSLRVPNSALLLGTVTVRLVASNQN
eukprot:scaffold1769_cov164-Ochromonas_danica.AAC.10